MNATYSIPVALAALLAAGAAGLAQDAGRPPKRMVLVQDGEARCRILVADRPGQEYAPQKWNRKLPGCWLHFAAHDLASYLHKSTGAEVEVITDPAKVKEATASADGRIRIHLGMTPYAKTLNLDLPTPHGFVIAFPDSRNIVIAGVLLQGKDYNTMYGVHYLLRRYVGVRWLFPGELGEHVPQTATLAVPAKDVREVPDFPLRSASGWGRIYAPSHRERWAGVYWDMRTGGTHSAVLQYNHNIGNIIDPDTYRETHPEFFPILDGRRFVPGPEMKQAKGYVHGWEPCYSAAGIAEEAAKRIVEHFDRNPGTYTYSLAVNDGARICECQQCRQRNLPLNRQIPENAGLRPDDPAFSHLYHSQTYYEWANQVVGKVREKYPDRYFGLLGYSRVSIPPEHTMLDDHIVPVLAWDFRYFDDPVARAKSTTHVGQWRGAANTLGWWDYTFEGSYLIPAFSAHHVADTLKYLHGNGLRFYFDELHPGEYFRNAPQEYMKRRLLWDIALDPDKLLGEWFELAVGKQAAPALAQYFALWEEYWTTQVPKTEWYRERVDGGFVAPFLDRRFCGYMDTLTRDRVVAAEKLLRTTVELAGTEKQKRRARFFHDYYAMAMKTYFLPYISYAETARNKTKPAIRRVLSSDDFNGPRPGKNPEFQGWSSWKRGASTAVVATAKGEGRGETDCLLFRNEDSSVQSGLSFTNNFDMPPPGKTYRFSGWYKVMEKSPCREQVSLNIWLYTEKGLLGAVLGSKGALRFRERQNVNTEDMGKWREVSITLAVPEDAWKDVVRLYCFLSAERAPVGTRFWFDDFSVVELDDGK